MEKGMEGRRFLWLEIEIFGIQFYCLLKYKFQLMRSERHPTSRSISSSRYSNNFQLLKTRHHNLKLDPEYDDTPPKSINLLFPNMNGNDHYRIRKRPLPSSSQRSENNRSVYEIYNMLHRDRETEIIRKINQPKVTASHNVQVANIDRDLRTSSGKRGSEDQSHQMEHSFAHSHPIQRNGNRFSVLERESKMDQPIIIHPQNHSSRDEEHTADFNRSLGYVSNNAEYQSPSRVLARRSRENYEERQWQMKQSAKAVQCNTGSIKMQQMSRQSPLSPSSPEDFNKVYSRFKPVIDINMLPQEQHENETLQRNPHPSQQDVEVQQTLLKQINSKMKYYRYRHQHKLLSSSPSSTLKKSKLPSQHEIEKLEFEYRAGKGVEEILKILHKQNRINQCRVTIKVPEFFHHAPDPYLTKQQLKFKAMMYFEDMGILKAALNREENVRVIKHTQSLMFLLDWHEQEDDEEEDKKYCINWYIDGSVFMGTSKGDCRHGVGLQWVPGEYIYYGQYNENYRQGYGIMKKHDMSVYVGTWSYDGHHGYGKVFSAEGLLIEAGVYRDNRLTRSGVFNELT